MGDEDAAGKIPGAFEEEVKQALDNMGAVLKAAAMSPEDVVSVQVYLTDAATFEKASAADTSQPQRIENTMAFMFETRSVLHPTRYALQSPLLQGGYGAVWADLKKHFRAPRRPGRKRARRR